MTKVPRPLQFFVGKEFPENAGDVAALLVPNRWDDYGFRTLFNLELRHPSLGRSTIGPVKILSRVYPEDHDDRWSHKMTVDVLPRHFATIDRGDFCSLGQSSDYYSRLGRIENGGYGFAAKDILRALADVCFQSASAPKWWQAPESGFDTSLLRFADAHIAMRESQALLEGRAAGEDNIQMIRLNDLQLDMSISPHNVELRFDGSRAIPGRINVLIGRNGVGKSLLLSRLASALSAEPQRNREEYVPRFSRILFVSYNAFDSGARRVAAWERSGLRFVGYKPGDPAKIDPIMVTARRLAASRTSCDEWQACLKNSFPTPDDWIKAIPFMTEQDENLVELGKDRDWATFVGNVLSDSTAAVRLSRDPQMALSELSPGQRVLVSLHAGLFANLDRRSLVLIDEPENHLHPSMLALFVRQLAELLSSRHSYAVIVTHSPVVLQETPSRDVWIMEREDDTSTLTHPPWETFGDSVDSITQYLFDTDFANSNWKATLHECAGRGMVAGDVEKELSNKELPLLARTYLESLLAQRRGAQ